LVYTYFMNPNSVLRINARNIAVTEIGNHINPHQSFFDC
jgi:hypothetical protein